MDVINRLFKKFTLTLWVYSKVGAALQYFSFASTWRLKKKVKNCILLKKKKFWNFLSYLQTFKNFSVNFVKCRKCVAIKMNGDVKSIIFVFPFKQKILSFSLV